MILVSRLVWLATGVAWAGSSALQFAGADYWNPVSALDWSAAWIYSVALCLLAPSMLLLARLAGSRQVSQVASVVAIAALGAGLANAAEHGLGFRGLGTLYVVTFVAASIGLVALVWTFQRAGRPRLVGLTVALVVGVAFFTVGGGLIVLGAFGALALAPRWLAEPAPVADALVPDGSAR